ncbi:uncharacterized protein AMSG_02789 [Thecamonas trahens ATCC 50062]|uniref:Uncharacterized protein n=1 Tax=Thecamonas trahens ATCC 50062 TaxID=461836 RepID=A0A0L0D233_THETB|nr:hypothetical protein AMSG_02789 [Thecamonas trahens ATCC 50062]KNC46337.1 hypothetical protein AMSG_02789 [Thecamonas trahens ATCC 50062]|eukprot:XP_013760630.1 hypothetical protein AMSG_02789 [Thecamonas trahens ATCC 50062]
MSRKRSRAQAETQGQTVLDEGTYQAGLANAVEAEFFPQLPLLRLRAQLAEAEDAGDALRVRGLRAAIASRSRSSTRQGLKADSGSGSGSGSGSDSDDDGDERSRVAKRARTLGVTRYLATYVSEDNAAFEEAHIAPRSTSGAPGSSLAMVPLAGMGSSAVAGGLLENGTARQSDDDGTEPRILPVNTNFSQPPPQPAAGAHAAEETMTVDGVSVRIGRSSSKSGPTVNGYSFVREPSAPQAGGGYTLPPVRQRERAAAKIGARYAAARAQREAQAKRFSRSATPLGAAHALRHGTLSPALRSALARSGTRLRTPALARSASRAPP